MTKLTNDIVYEENKIKYNYPKFLLKTKFKLFNFFNSDTKKPFHPTFINNVLDNHHLDTFTATDNLYDSMFIKRLEAHVEHLELDENATCHKCANDCSNQHFRTIIIEENNNPKHIFFCSISCFENMNKWTKFKKEIE